MRSFIGEFKDFISRGNVIDLAVGIIIGGAFTGIVKSLVDDIVMPLVAWVVGGKSFAAFTLTLPALRGHSAATTLGWGLFVQNIVNFLLVALVIFMLVKTVNAIKRNKEDAKDASTVEIREEIALLSEIRDALKSQIPTS